MIEIIVLPLWWLFEFTGIAVGLTLSPEYQEAVRRREQAVADYDARHPKQVHDA